jgi:LuxR family maltose regulon positive regulatory protein
MDSLRAQSASGLPLLETKLHVPGWRPGLVSRPRLVSALNRRAGSKLTLVSAPAGFGKSTLLAEWLAADRTGNQPAAWVSLDSGDNDPTLFWTYVITALRTSQRGLGEHALALLHSPQPPPIESVMTILINELSALEDDVALILDDLHVIEAQPVHGAIAFLLDHLPPRLRLVIATRADPPLPLARLRGRGELTEVRAADLRFTRDEAAAFFNEMIGLDLAAGDVAALETRTEGWIAGLQLAALSMQGQRDVSGFIQTFAGDHRYVVDYLIEEVLQQQADGVRSFLLQTAVLDRLTGPLCDAVTGQDGGTARLEALERGNFFVVPLDDTRRWYRYHHLFADVLRARLMAEQPDLVATLHQRASMWCEQQGSAAEAIRHAFAAEDFVRAAELIEWATPAMRRSRQEATLLGWLRALPDAVVRRRPVLNIAFAGTLLSVGEVESVEARLRDAERWLETKVAPSERPEALSAEMVNLDESELERLPASIAMYRAGRALALGDVASAIVHAQRVLDLVAEDDLLERGAAAAMLGLAAWTSGDLEAAHRSYAEGMARLHQAGHISDTVGGAIALADIRIVQGRLREAMSTYERALRLASEQSDPLLRGVVDMHVGLSELHRERGDLDAALRHLLTSHELGEHAGFHQFPYRSRVAMARIRQAEGDLDGALELLHEAERRYMSDFYPNVRPIAAMKARVWVVQGQLDRAFEWARGQGLSADDDLSYLREFEHVTLARMLITLYKRDRKERSIHEAMGLLERLLESAEAGGRTGTVIEILMLQALAYEARGSGSHALAPLERALALAEPEDYIRTFVDEGDPMRNLLRQAAPGSAYARRLLRAFDEPALASSAMTQTSTALAEPLTAREIEILRLIAAGMRNQEIADRLFISLATVKRHVANAYGKLDAGHRTEAIARANELNLL